MAVIIPPKQNFVGGYIGVILSVGWVVGWLVGWSVGWSVRISYIQSCGANYFYISLPIGLKLGMCYHYKV